MLLIEIDRIKIPENRQRRDFNADSLQQLADSIDSLQLFHPIIVRPSTDDENGYFLVAGERRLRAIRDYLWPVGGKLRFETSIVPEGFVPCVYLGELTAIEAAQAELEENVIRVDLSWQEKARATEGLKTLRSLQAEHAGKPEPTIKELAIEIKGVGVGQYQEDVRQDIILARHLNDPDVAKAKTAKDAYKILKAKEQTKRHKELGEKVGLEFGIHSHRAWNGTFQEQLFDHPSNYFDVILTDPPYGMGADEFQDAGGAATPNHSYDDSYANWVMLIADFAKESYRVAKAEAHLYMFCDVDNFKDAKISLSFYGWNVFRTPLIWHKPNGNRAPWPQQGPQRKYETILYAVKGKKPTTKLAPDLVTYSSDENLGLSAQKPVGLYIDLLRRSVQPGDAVLDCFMGTGTIFPACHELKCRATGIEMDTASYGIALQRLKDLK